MDPRDRETVAPPPQDEDVVFAAAARQVVAAVQLSSTEIASHHEQIHARIARADVTPPALPFSNVSSAQQRRPVSEFHRGPQIQSRWTPSEGRFKGQPLRQRLRSVAATFVIVIAIAMIGWSAGVHYRSPTGGGSVLTYSTGNGERATITLPDGSKAVLNVGSRLEIPADFVTGHRTVQLVGEALFTVPHQTGTPFVVLAGPTTTRVLGTSFVVRHYTNDSATTIMVRDGKVAVRSIVLTAAQQAVIDASGTMQMRPADSTQFSFATGILTLDDVPLSEAIPDLDRWYDIDIRLGDPKLGAVKMIGEFAAGSLADVQNYLAESFNVRVVRNGRVLTLFLK